MQIEVCSEKYKQIIKTVLYWVRGPFLIYRNQKIRNICWVYLISNYISKKNVKIKTVKPKRFNMQPVLQIQKNINMGEFSCFTWCREENSENHNRYPKRSGSHSFILSNTATDTLCPSHNEGGKNKYRQDSINHKKTGDQKFFLAVDETDNT